MVSRPTPSPLPSLDRRQPKDEAKPYHSIFKLSLLRAGEGSRFAFKNWEYIPIGPAASGCLKIWYRNFLTPALASPQIEAAPGQFRPDTPRYMARFAVARCRPTPPLVEIGHPFARFWPELYPGPCLCPRPRPRLRARPAPAALNKNQLDQLASRPKYR